MLRQMGRRKFRFILIKNKTMTIVKIDGIYHAVMRINQPGMTGLYSGQGYTHTEALNEAIENYYKQLIPF